MRIISAELIGWRNYTHQALDFTESPTVLVGPNGQGKTNFVEALVYATTGHSHRTSSDAIMVRSGEGEAIIRMSVEHNSRKVALDIRVAGSGANTIHLNGAVTKRRDLARLFPTVLFAPEDMDLVRGEPDSRRTFLNDVLTDASPGFAGDLADFERVLRQRNTLLKSMRANPSAPAGTFDAWTDSLVVLAARIMTARRRLVVELSPLVAAHYRAIAAADETLALSLSESIPEGTPDDLLVGILHHTLNEKRAEEIDRGSTLVGPHRDDLTVVLNGLPARTHSSQGEAWSAALALRLAQVDLVRRNSVAGDPVVILDDVFSELDSGRRARLGQHLAGIEHLIITAADESTIPDSLGGHRHVVREGKIDA